MRRKDREMKMHTLWTRLPIVLTILLVCAGIALGVVAHNAVLGAVVIASSPWPAVTGRPGPTRPMP